MLNLILLFFGLILTAIGVAWLADHPGAVTITWMGWRADTSFSVLMMITVAAVCLLLFTLHLLRRVLGMPSRMQARRTLKNHTAGLKALTEGIAALALSDLRTAKTLTRKAERHLGDAPIAHLLSAQIARLEGDETKTRRHLEAMLDHKETSYLAARHLSEYALKQHNIPLALEYTERAGRLHARDRWSNRALIDIYLRLDRWQEALHVIDRAQRSGALPKKEAAHLRGMAYFLKGQKLLTHGDAATALSFARQCNKYMGGFAPAALLLARAQHKNGQDADAVKTLRQSWKSGPRQEIAAFFLEVIKNEDEKTQIKEARKMAGQAPDSPESGALVASAAVRFKQWKLARQLVKQAMAKEETARLCRLMAEIEKGESGDFDAAAHWQLRAASAPLDPAWLCGSCAHVASEWSVHCPSCHAFDSMTWNRQTLNLMAGDEQAVPG